MIAPAIQLSVPMKSSGIAYLLWLFFGGVGAHKFYLGRPGVAVLYICMAALFWFGMVGLLAVAAQGAMDAFTLALQQGTHPSPVRTQPSLGPSGMKYLGMVAPLTAAYLYDLVTIPSQVRAANERLVSHAQDRFGISSEESSYRAADGSEAIALKNADELIARHLSEKSQSASKIGAPRAVTGNAPTFGRRRS